MKSANKLKAAPEQGAGYCHLLTAAELMQSKFNTPAELFSFLLEGMSIAYDYSHNKKEGANDGHFLASVLMEEVYSRWISSALANSDQRTAIADGFVKILDCFGPQGFEDEMTGLLASYSHELTENICPVEYRNMFWNGLTVFFSVANYLRSCWGMEREAEKPTRKAA